MKFSSISVSNGFVLSLKEWLVTLVLCIVIGVIVYHGWDNWEHYAPGSDYRETCWAERQSDYWTYMRWSRYAKEHYKVLLVGDSVIWGQEVPNDETISHYINEFYGEEIVANVSNDGLHMAGIEGFVRYYGDHLDNTNVIVQCSPLWLLSMLRDLRGEKKSSYHHPRLIPQFDSRITYYQDLNTRLGYIVERYIRIFPFVRHLMVNYFENKSISTWIMDNPYSNPFAAVDFVATPMMTESQGRGVSWKEKKMKIADEPFIDVSESVQFECYCKALSLLRKKNTNVFVLLGPFNRYYLTPESQKRLFATLDDVKKVFDDMGIPYFDTFALDIPSETFGDSCHLLKEGHIILARELVKDQKFRQWLAESNE